MQKKASTRITILVDNIVLSSSPANLLAEHGFSALIETERQTFLYDTGSSGIVLLNNAHRLKKDLKNIDAIILSHNHSDHTGGLFALLDYLRKDIRVYAHHNIFKKTFSKKTKKITFIGIPFAKEMLESLGANFIFLDSPIKINENIFLSYQIESSNSFEITDQNLLKLDENGQLVPDTFEEDLSIYFKNSDRLSVLTGCAHMGVINIVEQGKKVTGCKKLGAIIGGSHLGPASKEQQDKTIEALKELTPERIAFVHCTGLEMISRCANELKDKFIFSGVGSTFEV
ncbi:beta-lactamase domain protein [Thermodesulfobium narugense DSM 14796]|uniref:Beta-lactamase domain protein n=1 Tax=Thermodesulfobium narugense DSM 14796 TaxID=747365 RepID=M1E491_9BACT|nr:MBL fold metallo-hydrolase [Thermodesulfobium narugense]AEE13837.1 beta-lactamase domain protein [Thermodesulfobium narugense DSM 14796]